MPFICLDCYEIYEDNIKETENKNGNIRCPKRTCYGDVVQIDELLIPTIILLNKKGYRTSYCCSGHFTTSMYENAYIMFKHNCQPPTIPKGFNGEYNFASQAYVIRKWFKEDVEKERVENTLTTALELYKWADSLPENENCIEEDGE